VVVDLRRTRLAERHRHSTVTITEMTGHDAETVGHDPEIGGHDGPKYAGGLVSDLAPESRSS
jgi:hypothetical protein